MNIVDGACSKCGAPTIYDGTLPILCSSCRSAVKAAEDFNNLFNAITPTVSNEYATVAGKFRRVSWEEYMMAR
jgi:hypothetical protein